MTDLQLAALLYQWGKTLSDAQYRIDMGRLDMEDGSTDADMKIGAEQVHSGWLSVCDVMRQMDRMLFVLTGKDIDDTAELYEK